MAWMATASLWLSMRAWGRRRRWGVSRAGGGGIMDTPPPNLATRGGPTLFLLLSQHCRLARIWLSMACTQASRSSKLPASKCHVWPVLDTMMNSKFSSSAGPETPPGGWWDGDGWCRTGIPHPGSAGLHQHPPPHLPPCTQRGAHPGVAHHPPAPQGPPLVSARPPGREGRTGQGMRWQQARMGHSRMHEWSRPRATHHVTCFINIS